MERTTSNLFPMTITPFNFNKGDLVKKCITELVVSPFVGIVTAIIPSTNKVEVQWPYDRNTIEDPSELIKVNPFINPPTVKEDLGFNTYQKNLSDKENNPIQPHDILKEYLNTEFRPILLKAAQMYNQGMNKRTAFFELLSECNNKHMVISAVEKVYKNEINLKIEKEISFNSDIKKVKLTLSGDDASGFDLFCNLEDNPTEIHFNDLKTALSNFKKLEEVISKLTCDEDTLTKIVKQAQKLIASSDKETINTILNIK